MPGETVLTENGVTIIGAGNLPSTHARRGLGDVRAQHQRPAAVPGQDGELALDPVDEIHAGVVVSHDGQRHPSWPLTSARRADRGGDRP